MGHDKADKGSLSSNLRAASATLRRRAETSEGPHEKEGLLSRADELENRAAELDSSQVPATP